MERIKKLAFIFLISLFALGACTSNDGETGNGNEGGDNGDKASDVTEIRITWRGSGEGQTDNIRRYLEEFESEFENENPDIDIVLSPIIASEGDYFSKIALAMQSPETAPDIVSEDTFMLPADANAGLLKNLDDYVANWDEWDNFIENIKEGVLGQDGSVYGIPTTTDSRGLWYNKEVFEKAGLPLDWQPQNWDDIIAAAKQIKENVPDVVPFAMHVATVNGEATSMQTFEMLLYGTGETLYDGETQKWNVNGQGIVDSLKFVDAIMNNGLGPSLSIALSANYASVMMQDLLPNGGAGIVLDGSWNIGNYLDGGAAPLDDPEATLGFALMPTQNGQEPGTITMSGGWSWAIPAQSKNHDVAWKVIQAMSTKESQARRAYLEGTLTVREDSTEDPDYANRPFIDLATKALENARFRPKNDQYSKVSIEIQKAVEAVASGSLTPEEAAEAYKKAVIDIVGEENTY